MHTRRLLELLLVALMLASLVLGGAALVTAQGQGPDYAYAKKAAIRDKPGDMIEEMVDRWQLPSFRFIPGPPIGGKTTISQIDC